jgi:hypothetical protein
VDQQDTELDFVNCGLETSEDLLARVITVLDDIYSHSPSDIYHARRLGGSVPFNLRNDSIRLLYLYQFIWRPRRGVAFFLRTQVSYPLKALIIGKAKLEDAAVDSALYSTEEFVRVFEYRHRLNKQKKLRPLGAIPEIHTSSRASNTFQRLRRQPR